MKTGAIIATRIEDLVKKSGTKRVYLGVLMGAPKDSSPQWRYVKFNNFLRQLRRSKLNLNHLEKIADFFGKDISWFFSEEGKDS